MKRSLVDLPGVFVSWLPFVTITLIGGTLFLELVENQLTRMRRCRRGLALSIGLGAALLAAYGILQESVLGDYTAILLTGGFFESALEAAFTGVIVFLMGGIFWERTFSIRTRWEGSFTTSCCSSWYVIT